MHKGILILFVFFFISCVNKKDMGIDINIQEINISNLKETDLSEFQGEYLSHYKFVKLETTDDCLLGWIEKMYVDEDFLFVKDTNKKLFVFDKKGNYLNTIGQIGGGPEEMYSLSDFYIDPVRKKVFIFDYIKFKVFEYDYFGKLIRISECNNSFKSFVGTIDFFNDHVILSMDNNVLSLYNFRIIKANNSIDYKECIPYPVVDNEVISFKLNTKVTKNTNACYACAYLNDTIYMYDKESFQPKYVLKSRLKIAEDTYFNKDKLGTNILKVMNDMRNDGMSTGINSLYAMDDYLFIPYFINDNSYWILWSISKNEGFFTKNSFSNSPFFSMNNIKTTTNNALVCVIPMEEILEGSDNGVVSSDSQVIDIINRSNEDDNPIVGFYYFR